MSSSLGRVGEMPSQDGATQPIRLSKYGALVTADGHARYMEANYRGHLFTAGNTAVQALSLIAATTYTGLCLINPSNSGVDAVVDEITIAVASAPAALSQIVLAYNTAVPTTLTTPVTSTPAKISSSGSSGAKCLTYSAVTLPVAGTILRSLGHYVFSTAVGFNTQSAVKDEVAGSIMLLPGTSIQITAVTTAISVVASYTWEELPSPPW